MAVSALEALLRRDRAVVAAALAALTVVAWSYTLWLAHDMRMMGEMSGMRMDAAAMGAAMSPAASPWTGAEFVLMFVMWAVMMVGMMLPSAAPMILIYARVGRQAALQGKPLAATGFFAGGYLLAWAVFSLAATLAQGALQRVALLGTMMESESDVLGGLLLIAAGIFQWTPLKDSCLAHCRAPLAFIQHHGGFRRDPVGSLGIGFRHGIYCVGCCWALMALLFVFGVMNVFWIAVLAIFVLLEKIVPFGRAVSRGAGAVLTFWGTWLLASAALA